MCHIDANYKSKDLTYVLQIKSKMFHNGESPAYSQLRFRNTPEYAYIMENHL